MNRLQAFKTAYYLHHAGKVRKDKETKNRIYYTVEDEINGKDHSVIIELNEESILTAKCDCTLYSLRALHKPICSHIITALTYSMFELGRPKKMEE